MGEEKKQQDGYVSTLQALHRIAYGVPGRRAKLPRRSERPTGAWGSSSDGGYFTPQKHQTREPLDHPPFTALRRTQDMTSIYSEVVRISSERENRYKDYEDMILDATIASAIELMVDDSCQFSREQGSTVWVSSENDKIVKAGEELFDRIELEENLFDWAFNIALYGDFFLKIEANDKQGVLRVQDDYHPADVQRIDVNGALLAFRTPRNFVETTQGGPMVPSKNEGDEFWDPWDWVHFRIQASQRRRREIERQRMAPMLRFEKNLYRVTTKYGVSVVESARRLYKQVAMVEQSMIISRMTRAILKYIYKINCGTDAEMKSSVDTVLRIKDLLSQQTGLRVGESFEQQFSPPSGSEDIFLPVMGEKGDVQIATLGGENNVSGIVDIEYLRTKMFGALKVPPAFLGTTEDLPGSLGESALLRMDIRYARTVKRIQRSIIQGLTRLLQIHLAYKHLPVDPKQFSVEMDVVSTAEEEERKASLMSALGVAGELTNLNTAMRLQVPAKRFARLVYTDLLSMPGEFIDVLEEATEAPPEMAEGPAGPAGAGMPPTGGMGELPSPDELPPPEEGPGAELELPPETAPGAEQMPGAELELPPGPGESEQRKERVRAIKEREKREKFISVSVRKAAKRDAMESVTSAVRASSDLHAKLHDQDGEKSVEVSQIMEEKEHAGLREAIRYAVTREKEGREKERERWEEVIRNINDGQRVEMVRS